MLNIRIPVVDPDHKPLMPTTASRARRWVRDAKAAGRWSDLSVYYVQLCTAPSGYATQEISIGLDPGKRYSGIAAQSQKATLIMLHLVLMGFLPKQGTAIPGVKEKMAYRRMLRRGRRGRRINRKAPFKERNHREVRFDNRRQSKSPPWIRSNRELELRTVRELCRMLPVSSILYEVVKADVDRTSGRKRAKSGKGFSPVMVGQKWMLEQLRRYAPVSTREGWQKDGNGTSQICDALKLHKEKERKEVQSPETHCVDGIALAASQFIRYEAFRTANSHGRRFVGGVVVTPSVFKVISRPRITRRRLHDAVPAKGGVRERYGGGMTPFGIRKGDLVRYGTQIGYCSGYTGEKLSISDASWKRLGQRAISRCQLVSRSTGLVVSGISSPIQPPLLSLPAAKAVGYLGGKR